MQQQLAYRVSRPDKVTWTGLRAAWKDEAFYQAVGERTGEILFVRHITLLQMKEAEVARHAAAEVCHLPQCSVGKTLAQWSVCHQ